MLKIIDELHEQYPADEYLIREIIGKEITFNGKKFRAYKLVQKDNRLIDFKFTQAVRNIPDSLHFVVVANRTNCNVDNNYKYPRIWCRDVEKFIPITSDSAKLYSDEI